MSPNALLHNNSGSDPRTDPIFFIPNCDLSLESFTGKAFRVMKGSDPGVIRGLTPDHLMITLTDHLLNNPESLTQQGF